MKYCAFIRNIMIGRKGMTREVVLDAFTQCGALNASSFLVTGNIVFGLKDITASAFHKEVTAFFQSSRHFSEPFFIRSFTHLKAIATDDPFSKMKAKNVYIRCITFLPGSKIVLPEIPYGTERKDLEIFKATKTEVFSLTYLINDRPGNPGGVIEKYSGRQVTTRNFNTVERLLKNYM